MGGGGETARKGSKGCAGCEKKEEREGTAGEGIEAGATGEKKGWSRNVIIVDTDLWC